MFVVTIVVWAIQLIMVGQVLDQIHRQDPRDPCHEFRSTEHILLCQVDATASRQAGSEPKKPMLFTAHTAHTHTHLHHLLRIQIVRIQIVKGSQSVSVCRRSILHGFDHPWSRWSCENSDRKECPCRPCLCQLTFIFFMKAYYLFNLFLHTMKYT